VARLIYSAITSLDGFVADESGNFDWAAPDEEVHTFLNDLGRPVGTYLYGRRMYEVMAVWESLDTSDEPPLMADFAELWRAADKIVYSRTLQAASTPKTRIERDFDPGAIRELKATATGDIGIGGPGLAAHAVAAGLVDDYHLVVTPVLVGGGTPAFAHGARARLVLVSERRFGNGMVHLHYRPE
jgi:dihydrofolate reductase